MAATMPKKAYGNLVIHCISLSNAMFISWVGLECVKHTLHTTISEEPSTYTGNRTSTMNGNDSLLRSRRTDAAHKVLSIKHLLIYLAAALMIVL